VSFRGWPPPGQEAMKQHIGQHEQKAKQVQDDQQKAMQDQEKALREIRATTESAGKTREELGKALVQALVGVLTGTDEAKPTSAKSGDT